MEFDLEVSSMSGAGLEELVELIDARLKTLNQTE
jgi:hypothetical protein